MADAITRRRMYTIEKLPAEVTPREFDELGALLRDAVEHGASVGYILPLDPADVAAFWKRVIADRAVSGRLIWVAREEPGRNIIATAQLAPETKPNGRHRAEVQKVLVHSSWRRRGLATALMREVESAAARRGLSLLFLDTSEGRGGAQALYERLGYIHAGGLPNFALDPDSTPAANLIYYKLLAAPPSG